MQCGNRPAPKRSPSTSTPSFSPYQKPDAKRCSSSCSSVRLEEHLKANRSPQPRTPLRSPIRSPSILLGQTESLRSTVALPRKTGIGTCLASFFHWSSIRPPQRRGQNREMPRPAYRRLIVLWNYRVHGIRGCWHDAGGPGGASLRVFVKQNEILWRREHI